MAVAKSKQPATARKPMGVLWLGESFPVAYPPACRRCNRIDREHAESRLLVLRQAASLLEDVLFFVMPPWMNQHKYCGNDTTFRY